jgi:ABC-type Fe3+/spermidine/putrescine transport system ATPase subunit
MSLELRNVGKDFATREGSHSAVTDISLTFDPGTFHTLLGPSGCGKTTLLRLIAGLEHPTRGEILHDGRPLNDVPPYARGFPMVFQSYALFPHMTVVGNVGYGLRVRKLPRAEIERRVDRALALLGLQPERHRHPAQMSGGQQQRVALARCLVLEPDVILLDEPLSSLDAELRIGMRRELRMLQRKLGITAIHVTHDQEEAMAIADRLVVMNRGAIEQIGAPPEIYSRPANEFVARFMGCPNIFPVTAAGPNGIRLLGAGYEGIRVADRPMKAVIRSDAVTLSATGGRHDAVVEDVTFLGARIQYVLRLDDDTRLTVDGQTDVAGGSAGTVFARGAAVTFELLPQRLHLIPAAE